MPEEFGNPQNLNEESFKDEAENLKYLEKGSREKEGFRKDQERIEKASTLRIACLFTGFGYFFGHQRFSSRFGFGI